MPFSFRRLRKAHLVAVGVIALAGITTLAVTRFGWFKTAPVAKPVAGAPAQTRVKALPLGKGYLQRQGIWPQLRSALDAYGDRLEKPGKERLTAVGTISNASTTANEKVPVRLIFEFPDKLRIEKQKGNKTETTVFDGKLKVKLGDVLKPEEEEELEALVFDSVDHFMAAHMLGKPLRFLGDRFRLDDGTNPSYTGPYYDLYSAPTPDASDKTTVTPNAYNKPGAPNVRMAAASTDVRSETGATVARTEFFYDNALTTANPIHVRTWDSAKGNLPLSPTNSANVYTAYDTYGNITLVTDARNIQTKFEYGAVVVGNPATENLYPTNIRKAFGTSVQLNSSLTYDFNTGLPLTATDDDNNVTNKTTYDDLGRPTSVKEAYSVATNTAVRQTTSQYLDPSRTVITRSDLTTVGDGKIVSIQHHDQLGRLRLARTLEDPDTQSATDETAGIKVQTRFMYTSTHTYKVVSNPYRAVTSTAASSESTMGWAREKVDRSGLAMEAETFDGAGLPAPWGTNANSMGLSTVAHDANYTTTTDPAGKIKRTLRDALGRLIRTDEPNASNSLGTQDSPVQATSYSYDALNRLTQVAQGVQTRSFVYSSLSRLLSATNPEKNGADIYEYDANGNATKHTDARGWYTTATFDELNRVKTIDYSNTTVNPDLKKFYDNPTAGKYGKGRYWYDYAGGDATTGQTVEYSGVNGYDILGRPLSLTQKFKTAGAWSADFPTLHLYDLAGNVKEKTLPSLHKITYSFDAIGRLSQMSGNIGDNVQRTYTTGIVYNAGGQMTREQFGTTTPLYHNRHFNNRGQLYDVRLGTGSDQGTEWTWNRGALRIYYGANNAIGNGGTLNNGNVYRVDHFIPLNDAASQWFMPVDYYGFDELNRITGIWEQTYNQNGAVNYNALHQTYTYDRYGNRTVNGTLNVTSPSFKYVAATNRQKAPTDSDTDSASDKLRYDAVGNLIKDIHTQSGTGERTYDINNQMLTAVGPNGLLNTYAYDGAGHRVRRSINNGASNWWQVYGIGGEVVAEYAAGANPNAPLKEYGYRQGEMLIVGDVGAGCTTRWLVTDQVGTPRILADATGSLAGISRHDYLPLGEELTAGYGGRTNAQGYTGDCVRDKFVGYERDAETGLDYAEARYYGSVYGRFTSVDPAMGSARKSLPQSWNRYSYVMNQPLSLVDPTGEFWKHKQNEELAFVRKGFPTQKEWDDYTKQGYELIADNTMGSFGGGGTAHWAEYNHERVVLGDDGVIHVIRSNAGDKIGALAVGMYLFAAGLALQAPEITALTALEMAILEAQVLGMGMHDEDENNAILRGSIDPQSLPQLQQGQAEKAISNGTNNVMVETRSEADAIRRTIVQGQGYENTSGLTGKEVREMLPKGKAGTFHWDYADTKHGGTPHVQIHTHEGRTIRIFFKEGAGLPIRFRGRSGRGR